MTTLEAQHEVITDLILENKKLKQERDEARNKMADALQEVDLRTLDFERMKLERDEARDTIMKIEEIFIDSEDMHDDWMKVGNIARTFCEKYI